MDANCATSLLFVHFITDCVAKARTPAKVQSCMEYIKFFLAQFLLNQPIAAPQVQLQLHSGKALHINSRGVIMNFHAVVESSHAGLVSSWGKQWDSMVNLRSAWSSTELHMEDVIEFVLTVDSARKSQQKLKHAWKNVSRALLDDLRSTFIKTLAQRLDSVILGNVSLFCGQQIPDRVFRSRRPGRAKC